jgi:hypothetical protein
MCTEVSTILRAVAADFFFNCWCLEIPSDNRIRHVPRCVHYHEESFALKVFQNFYVGREANIEQNWNLIPCRDTVQTGRAQRSLATQHNVSAPTLQHCSWTANTGQEQDGIVTMETNSGWNWLSHSGHFLRVPWDVTPCGSIKPRQRFGGKYSFHPQELYAFLHLL